MFTKRLYNFFVLNYNNDLNFNLTNKIKFIILFK